MKSFFINVLLFFFLTVTISGRNGEYFSFYSVHNLLIPYNMDTESININLMALNIGIVLMFIYNIIKRIDELFKMDYYILSRGKHKTLFFITNLKYITKEIYSLIIAKLIVDAIFSYTNNFHDINIAIQFSISATITALIWFLIILALRLNYLSNNTIYFLILFTIITSQLLSFKFEFFSLLVIASTNFFDSTILLIFYKLLFVLILMVYNYFAVLKYETIGA